MTSEDRPLAWLHGEIKSPPLSKEARIEVGMLLRKLQQGEQLAMPHSKALPSIGPRCHELRVRGRDATWRIIYRVDADAVIIAEVFSKKTRKTPLGVILACKERLRRYDSDSGD